MSFEGLQKTKETNFGFWFVYFPKQQQKIMNTIAEDKLMRAQKQRKQQYYKQMLDQQMNYNTKSKYEPARQQLPRPDNDRNHNYYGRQSYLEPSSQNEGYLPPINLQNRHSYKADHVSLRQRSQQDKTQIYLKNCQYIIKNLRQLKHKREKDQFLTMSTQPTPKEELDREPTLKKEIQYYPRNQYFSSQGKAYNKIYPVEAGQKYKKNVRNLEEESFYKNQQNPNKGNRVKSLPQKILKKHIANKYENEQKEEKNAGQSSSQSDIPSGFQEKRRLKHNNQTRQVSSRTITPSNTKRLQSREQLRDLQQKDEKEQKYEKEQRKQREQLQQMKVQENMKIQKQLVFCLSQLTKFLKNQNGNKLQDKNEQKQSDKDKDKQQKNIKSEVSSELQSQKNTIQQNQSLQNQKKQDQEKVQSLKNQAIVALKKLNEKSKEFMEFASNRTHQEKPKQEEPAKKRPSVKFVNNAQHKQSKDSKANPQKDTVQEKPAKPIIIIPVNIPSSLEILEPQKNASQNRMVEDIYEHKNEAKQSNINSELAKQLISYLQKQQNQNFQLSFCLKQLTQFLKITNDEMIQLKSSRRPQVQQTTERKQSISPREQTNNQVYEEQEQKAKLNKLQAAVLKKLKKARLRGNLFKQKVQKFRKEHHLIILKKQEPQKQEEEQNQVQINPITVKNSNLKEIDQNDEQEQEEKQTPIASQQKKTAKETKN